MICSSKNALRLLYFWLLTLLIPSAHAQEEVIIHYTHTPPFAKYNKGQAPSGIFVDVAVEFLKDAGLDFKAVYYPHTRFYYMIAVGEAGLVISFKSLLKPEHYAISKEKLTTLTLNLYRLKTSPAINDFSKIKNTRLSTLKNFIYDGVTLPNEHDQLVTTIPARSHQKAIKMLLTQRSDYLLDYEIFYRYVVKENQARQLAFDTVHSVDLYVAVGRKTIKNAEQVLKKIEASMAKMKHDKFIETSIKKHLKLKP